MRVHILCAGLLLTGGVIVTGCKSADTPAPPATLPTTAPTTEAAPTSGPVAPATAPAVTATHVVTKAQPYFAEVPASPTAAPAGTFASGTKVLLFSFSPPYAKVEAEDGTTGYTAIEGIDPISKK